MKRALCLAWWAAPLVAHVVSMSSGDLTIQGTQARYQLRMPAYEMPHVKEPERALFEHIRFSAGGEQARMSRSQCQADDSQGVYLCTAEYVFSKPVEQLDVECTFHSVTVPNHVHLLRAEMEGKRDQAIFDFSFTKANLRFRPPTGAELAVAQLAGGASRAVGGLVQILFLASLVIAARSRRELLAISGMFVVGQIAAALIIPATGWQPAVRFAEAAAALTIAYLAVEILALPQAGQRWLIAAVLGGFHGLWLEIFLQTTGYRPFYVLAGAAMSEILVIAILAFVFSRLARLASVLRPVQASASALLVVGMVWFFMRLRS